MPLRNVNENLVVTGVDVKDMRWPTSLGGHGSDAMVRSRQIFIHIFLFFIRKMKFKWFIDVIASSHSTPIPIIRALM